MRRYGLQFAAALLAATLHATAQGPFTFRIYSDLIQIPVLVTTHLTDPIPGLHFSVSLDSGPPFALSHVRLEGDDPVALAILIDVSGDQNALLPKLQTALASLAQGPLTARDRVSIYAVDCELVRTADNIPPDSAALLKAAHAAITSAVPHGVGRGTPTCHKYLRLWDNLAYIVEQLSSRPERRVILAITSGDDQDSKHSWSYLRVLTNNSAVSMFGLSQARTSSGNVTSYWEPLGGSVTTEPPFPLLCSHSGGETFTTHPGHLTEALATFVHSLRERYIVEFSRPAGVPEGLHDLRIEISKANGESVPAARIHPSGIAVPIADPDDPSTMHVTPTSAPTLGTRHILTEPK